MIPLRDANPYKNKPYMTWFLILSSVVAFVWQMGRPYEELEALVFTLGFVPADLTALVNTGFVDLSLIQVVLTSLFSCMFLHGSWAHLLGNMWSLWLFGDNVEDTIGRIPFLLFYLSSGVAASLAHYSLNMGSGIPVIGASGAIAGVMGAYVLLFPLARIVTLVPVFWIPFFFRIPAVLFIGLWFFLQLYLGLSDLTMVDEMAGGVAWWAHVGGFLFGLLMVYRFKGRTDE